MKELEEWIICFLKMAEKYNLYFKLSGTVHIRNESLQSRLRDMWTCKITLASTYILCHLSAI